MAEVKSDIHFRLMCLTLRLRDVFIPPLKVLEEAGIKQGDSVLDFGCGPGSFSLAAAALVGEKGTVFSLDVHPRAIKTVNRRSAHRGHTNIVPVFTEGETGLSDESLNAILVYDVFHELEEPEKNLKEWNRILRDDGVLSFSDLHIKEAEILSKVTQGNYFKLDKKGKKTYTFRKQDPYLFKDRTASRTFG
ncbi:MAG: methyltransferase domain-containing protein [Candidatus Aminicenantes bacterium]|nr:methyltransferase domain-containing protein [Candidatus Aminicenantes bacterium]